MTRNYANAESERQATTQGINLVSILAQSVGTAVFDDSTAMLGVTTKQDAIVANDSRLDDLSTNDFVNDFQIGLL